MNAARSSGAHPPIRRAEDIVRRSGLADEGVKGLAMDLRNRQRCFTPHEGAKRGGRSMGSNHTMAAKAFKVFVEPGNQPARVAHR